VVEQSGAGASRRAYHHGDLRNALTEAALEAARVGGPQGIVLREAARATGVSSTAAYRHFANHGELVEAVKGRGLAMLARAMRAELAAGSPCADRGDEAMRRLRAIGRGYVRFAFAEPGLFRTVFHSGADGEPTSVRRYAGATAAGYYDGTSPANDESYGLLSDALDDLVECGRLGVAERPWSDVALWSAVHGLSVLLLDTELARLPDGEKDAIVERGLDIALGGL